MLQNQLDAQMNMKPEVVYINKNSSIGEGSAIGEQSFTANMSNIRHSASLAGSQEKQEY
jgi:UDP-3-O-[3-hydroxymyristoyl] glucosamine N-acyltransferase